MDRLDPILPHGKVPRSFAEALRQLIADRERSLTVPNLHPARRTMLVATAGSWPRRRGSMGEAKRRVENAGVFGPGAGELGLLEETERCADQLIDFINRQVNGVYSPAAVLNALNTIYIGLCFKHQGFEETERALRLVLRHLRDMYRAQILVNSEPAGSA